MMMEHNYRYSINLSFLLFFLFTVELLPINFFTRPNQEWTAYILYIKNAKAPILKYPSEEADTISFVNYRDKVLIVEEGWGKFGWKKIVYPISGYISEKELMTFSEKRDIDKRFNYPVEENEYSKWEWEIISCMNEYAFLKEKADYASRTVGLLKRNDKVVIIKDQLNFPSIWVKSVYPDKGFIKLSDIITGQNYPYLALGITYGAIHMPYEKNLKNYFNPIGGYFEYSNANWNFGFRLGYNYTESRLTTFYNKTHQAYFHLLYRFLDLFNGKLESYALIGGNYWFSSFENKKYGTDNSYFKLERDCGPGFAVGAGIIYNISNFFIEAQYTLFWSRQAEFGNKPEQGSFTNYSTLYPGSNHIEIIFGYRFIL